MAEKPSYGMSFLCARARSVIYTCITLCFLPVNGSSENAAAQDLISRLHVPDQNARIEAEKKLINAGADAVPYLVAGMTDRRLKDKLEDICVKIGYKAVPALIALLKNPDLTENAGTLLYKMANPDMPEVFADILVCAVIPESKHYCGMALVRVAGPKSKKHIQAVSGLLKNTDADVRSYGALALGQIGAKAKSAVPALIEALKDAEPKVRVSAVMALGKIGKKAKEAAPALEFTSANDSDGQARILAKKALKNIYGK